MGAMDVEWHEQCLANLKCNLGRQEQQLSSLASVIERSRLHIVVYEQQIAQARRLGKTSFDSTKFLVKRKRGD